MLHPARGFVFNELPSAASSACVGCSAPLWLCLLSQSPGLTPDADWSKTHQCERKKTPFWGHLMFWRRSRSPSIENPGDKNACAESNSHSPDLGAELAGEKMKIIGDFSRDRFSKAPPRILDVGEPVLVENRAGNSKGGGEGSVAQPSHPKNGVPAPCATPNLSICPLCHPIQIPAQQHPAFIAIYSFLCNEIPPLDLFASRDYILVPQARRLARALGGVGRRDNGLF